MRFRLAALAASLAVTIGGTTPVFSASTQVGAGDSVKLFLVRLGHVLQESHGKGFEALLTETADRDQAAAFADTEALPGMTRAVIQERDRAPLAGTLPDDGYIIVVDVFEEFHDRARVATWSLALKRNRDDVDRDEWSIEDERRLSSVEDLYRLALNPAKQFTARNLEISDEDLKLTLAEGSVFVSEIDQGPTALVLVGRGEVSFRPTPLTERTQVRIFSGADAIQTRFDGVYLRINPEDFDRLISRQQLVSRPVDQNDFRAADRIFREDVGRSFSLDLGDLSPDPWSLVPRSGDVVADIHTRRFDTLTYSRSSSAEEDIGLFDRNTHKTIALYSSAGRHAGQAGAAYGTGDYSVRHYDIDVSSFPDRRWLEARARLSIRVGENPINTIALRLAEPLVVQSVVSPEYGRLFNMRVKDQNSVVVSLPTAVAPHADLTLVVTYAGRLEPQALDGESVAPAQSGPPRLDAGDILQQPEPSLVYSNESNWYPRAASGHFATAAIRITVPANFACVASGERAIESPVAVSKDSSRLQTYVFNAVQPVRYLAFVVSRFATAQIIATEHLSVSVEANPGHAKRGRDLAERAVDIAGFYHSLLEDWPYPSLTLALVEGERPGGHSPGYFAVVHEPVSPLVPFGPRRDPASFDGYPDFVIAHEIAHQWWGQAVGWRTYHDQWLSEGFAQYFAAMYAEQRTPGNAVFRGAMRQMRKWAIDDTDQGPISLGYRLGHIQGDSRIMRALVYDKGALVLHMLRGLVGDEVFVRGLRRFYHASRFRLAGTQEFQAAMEAESGRSLDRFFERWIQGSTLPRLTFRYRVDGDAVVLHIDQVGELFDVPVMVTLHYAGRPSTDVLVPVIDRSVDLRVPLAGTLRAADISKDDLSLASIVKN